MKPEGRSIFSLILLLVTGAAEACIPDNQTLCLEEGRFEVRVDWSDLSGNPKTLPGNPLSGMGHARTVNDSTGTFWLFTDQQHEMMVKVLDGCALNARYWVFAVAATNVEYTLTVTDSETSQVRQYFNSVLNEAPAVTDTDAFATCATPTTTLSSPVSPPQTIVFDPAEVGTCVSAADTLCLFSNRFSVQVDWRDFSNNMGSGFAVPWTNESGSFYFFAPDNLELLINVYDGRPANGNFWIFSAGATNVEFTIHVTDTLSGEQHTYRNPLGVTSVPVLDIGPGPRLTAVPVFSSYGLLLMLLAVLLLAGKGILHRDKAGMREEGPQAPLDCKQFRPWPLS